MSHCRHPHGACQCPSCGRLVHLNRNARYRRHYVVEHDGRRHLCGTSGDRAGWSQAAGRLQLRG
jgi:hypothetical protein